MESYSVIASLHLSYMRMLIGRVVRLAIVVHLAK
jgi:hypothetical protein